MALEEASATIPLHKVRLQPVKMDWDLFLIDGKRTMSAVNLLGETDDVMVQI